MNPYGPVERREEWLCWRSVGLLRTVIPVAIFECSEPVLSKTTLVMINQTQKGKRVSSEVAVGLVGFGGAEILGSLKLLNKLPRVS